VCSFVNTTRLCLVRFLILTVDFLNFLKKSSNLSASATEAKEKSRIVVCFMKDMHHKLQ
jgi:hypothetical protein